MRGKEKRGKQTGVESLHALLAANADNGISKSLVWLVVWHLSISRRQSNHNTNLAQPILQLQTCLQEPKRAGDSAADNSCFQRRDHVVEALQIVHLEPLLVPIFCILVHGEVDAPRSYRANNSGCYALIKCLQPFHLVCVFNHNVQVGQNVFIASVAHLETCFHQIEWMESDRRHESYNSGEVERTYPHSFHRQNVFPHSLSS